MLLIYFLNARHELKKGKYMKNHINFSALFKKNKISAFSLLEVMIALIFIGSIMAAFVPVTIKKINGKPLKINSEMNITRNCQIFSNPANGGTNSSSCGKCNFCDLSKNSPHCIMCDCSCPSGQYGVADSCSCKPCSEIDANCATCSSGSKCDACKTGYYIEDGMCVSCPEGYYCPDGVNKKECEEGYYCIKNSKNHTPCPDGKWSIKGSSVCTLECGEGYICKDGKKTYCSAGTYVNSDKTACISCETGYYCTGGTNHATCVSKTANCSVCDSSDGTCISCNSHYYKTSSNTCSSCSSSCYNCSSYSTCTSCYSGYYLSGGTCYVDCPSNCSSCSSSSTCTRCYSGYTLTNGRCVKNGVTCNVSNCSSCSSTNYCSKCYSGYTLSGGSCSKSVTCNVSNCNSCSSTNYCSSCESGYTLSSGKCTKTAESVTCDVANCTSCSRTNYCSSCRSNYKLSYGRCILQCPNGVGYDDTCVTCPSGYTYYYNSASDKTAICKKKGPYTGTTIKTSKGTYECQYTIEYCTVGINGSQSCKKSTSQTNFGKTTGTVGNFCSVSGV